MVPVYNPLLTVDEDMPLPMQLAREVIAYQTDGFKAKLVDAIKDLLAHENVQDAESSSSLYIVEKLIHQRTGVNIRLMINPARGGVEAEPFFDASFLTKTNVLAVSKRSGRYSPGIIKSMQRVKGSFDGSVDFKTGRLKGDYTKIEAPVAFGWEMMRLFQRPEYIAAIIMHEVGHAWTTTAMSWRTMRTSYFLAGIRDSLINGKKDGSISHIINELGTVLASEGLIESESDLNAASEMKEYTGITTLVYSQVYRKLATDIGTLASSAHQAESLADAYAARFGFAVEIGEIVERFNQETSGYFQSFATLGVAVAAASAGGPVGIGVGVVTILATLAFGGHSSKGTKNSEVNGSDEARINRLRLSIIDSLKDGNIPTAARQELISQEKALSEILKQVKSNSSFLADISNLLTSGRRNTAAAIKFEERLEKLSSNDLYVGGNALRDAADFV